MKKDFATFRMDVTFWLAILVLLATMLSRHVGRLNSADFNSISAGLEVPITGQNPDS